MDTELAGESTGGRTEFEKDDADPDKSDADPLAWPAGRCWPWPGVCESWVGLTFEGEGRARGTDSTVLDP